MTNHTDYTRLQEITDRLRQRYSTLDAKLDQIEATLDHLLDATEVLLVKHGVCPSCLKDADACADSIRTMPAQSDSLQRGVPHVPGI